MRKAINTAALVFLVWLVLDAFAVPEKLFYFLISGSLPGTSVYLSPTQMLAIMTGLIGLVLFESAARRFEVLRRIRKQFMSIASRREKLPARRYTRI